MKTISDKFSLKALLATAFVSASVLGFSTYSASATDTVLDGTTTTVGGLTVASSVPSFPVTATGASWLGAAQAGVIKGAAASKAYQIKEATLGTLASSLGAALDGKTLQERIGALATQGSVDTMQGNVTAIKTTLDGIHPTSGLTTAVNDMVNSYFNTDAIINDDLVFPGTNAAALSGGSAVIQGGNSLLTTFSSGTNFAYAVRVLSAADKLSIIFRAMFGILDADYNNLTKSSQESGVIVRSVFDEYLGTNRISVTNKLFSGTGTDTLGSVTPFGGGTAVTLDETKNISTYLDSVLGTGPARTDDSAILKALLLGIRGVPPTP